VRQDADTLPANQGFGSTPLRGNRLWAA